MRTTLLALTLAGLAAAIPNPLRAEDCNRDWAACYWRETQMLGGQWDLPGCDVAFLGCLMRAISVS